MERRIDRYGGREMRHSRSEDLLGTISRSPSPSIDLPTTTSEDDLIAASALRDSGIYDEAVGGMGLAGPSRRILPSPSRAVGIPVDPEDSIRDIVTENDLYRSVYYTQMNNGTNNRSFRSVFAAERRVHAPSIVANLGY